jgi:hypothetical protein
VAGGWDGGVLITFHGDDEGQAVGHEGILKERAGRSGHLTGRGVGSRGARGPPPAQSL